MLIYKNIQSRQKLRALMQSYDLKNHKSAETWKWSERGYVFGVVCRNYCKIQSYFSNDLVPHSSEEEMWLEKKSLHFPGSWERKTHRSSENVWWIWNFDLTCCQDDGKLVFSIICEFTFIIPLRTRINFSLGHYNNYCCNIKNLKCVTRFALGVA